MVLTITSRGKESCIYDNVWRQRAILGSLKSLNASESCFLFTELDVATMSQSTQYILFTTIQITQDIAYNLRRCI